MKTLKLGATALVAGLGLGLATSGTAAAATTDSFTATYKVTKSGLPLGKARFSLKPGKRDDCYIYAGHANPNMLVGIFLGDIHDETRFCMVDGQVQPEYFRHHIDGDRDHSYTLTFDWSAMSVRYADEAGEHNTYTLEPGAQDPMSLQIATRHWLATTFGKRSVTGGHEFILADDDGIEKYQVEVSDAGDVDTPDGRFDTVKLARTGKHHHALTFWLARHADFIPIQVSRLEDGEASYTLTIQSLSRGQ